ncbi:MAG: HlyD family secretion protein [Pyrinomonadaceae bacterium]
MDVKRSPSVRRRRIIRRILLIVVGFCVLTTGAVVLSRLKPAAPTVDRNTVSIDKVKRGQMLRQVRGLGTLVPETSSIRVIAASTNGLIERVLVQPGADVKKETVLITMSNPQLEQELQSAEYQLKQEEAQLSNLRVQLESQLLDKRATAATAQADYTEAQLNAETDKALSKANVIPKLTQQLSENRATEMATRMEIEKNRLAISDLASRSQIQVQEAKVAQVKAMAVLKRHDVDALAVRAGIDGVLQQIPVQVGQQISPGTNIARVVEPNHLKAELKIAEVQAKDIVIGQLAYVDTRNGVAPGRVVRIDPAAQNGTVTVDVKIDGEMPAGARPDLSVDGTIELERLDNVLYVGRPISANTGATIGLFKLVDGSSFAVRIPVKIGSVSVNTVEVVEGLQEGDQVILSDMATYDNVDRIQLR